MVAFLSPRPTQEEPKASTAPAVSPSVSDGVLAQTAVDPVDMRRSIAQQAGSAAIKNQDIVNYAYLVLMKEKGHSAPNAYEHAAAKIEKLFGVKLNEVEQRDRRQASSTVRVTEANREILASRFGIGATRTEELMPTQDKVTGQKIINDLYSQARQLQRQYGSNAGRLVGCRSNDEDAIVHRLAQIAGIKEATGHTVWEIANSHREATFSGTELHKDKFEKVLASVIARNHTTPSSAHATEHESPPSRERQTRQGASENAQPERVLEAKEFIATTVIEPGGRVFKHLRDTITDTHGNPLIEVARTRMNLGPLSFNLPGREYKVPNGVPEDQAKKMAKDYIKNNRGNLWK